MLKKASSLFGISNGGAQAQAKDMARQNKIINKGRKKSNWHIPFRLLKIGEKIGFGGHGQVFKGFYARRPVAIKVRACAWVRGTRDGYISSRMGRSRKRTERESSDRPDPEGRAWSAH